MAPDMSHERKMPGVYTTDFTKLPQQPDTFNRENDIDILIGIRMIIVDVRDR